MDHRKPGGDYWPGISDSHREGQSSWQSTHRVAPGVALTVVITALFGLFGLIPAFIHADRAKALGVRGTRYWKAFGITYACAFALQVGVGALLLAIWWASIPQQLMNPAAGSPMLPPAPQASLERERTARIGVKFDQPGLSVGRAGDPVGFEVDVARYVARELGYADVLFVETPSSQREGMLQAGHVDMIFATYQVTDRRKEVVSFAGPYLVVQTDLLVASNSQSLRILISTANGCAQSWGQP